MQDLTRMGYIGGLDNAGSKDKYVLSIFWYIISYNTGSEQPYYHA